MLNIKNRLKKKKEFSYIYRKGDAIHSKYLCVYSVDTKCKYIKIGFSISNKIGNSVIRHKVKRRLVEITRPIINTLPFCNYVFVAKPDIDKLSFEELKNEVYHLIDKVRMKKDKK